MSSSSSSSQALASRSILDANFDEIYQNWDLIDQEFNPSRHGEPTIMENFARIIVKEDEWNDEYRKLMNSLEGLIPDSKLRRIEYVMWYIRNNPDDFLIKFDEERMSQYIWLKLFVPQLELLGDHHSSSLINQLIANKNHYKSLTTYKKSRQIAKNSHNAVRN